VTRKAAFTTLVVPALLAATFAAAASASETPFSLPTLEVSEAVFEGEPVKITVRLDSPAARDFRFRVVPRHVHSNRHPVRSDGEEQIARRVDLAPGWWNYSRAVIRRGETEAVLEIPTRDDDIVERAELMSFRLISYTHPHYNRTPYGETWIFDNDADFELNVLHINDHHSHLEPNTSADLVLSGQETRVETGGFPRVVSKMLELESTLDNTIKLHAGDAITGTIFYSLFKGQADADLMNEVCFDAMALGNHEFDDGDAGLARFIGFLNDSLDCQTAVLAANVVPEVGTPLRPTDSESLIQPYVIKEIGGQQVGVIGIDIAGKTQASSSPLESTRFLDEKETAQRMIDELRSQGVDKIILLSHYQYENEVALARELSGIDVVVGGDSHSLLGDSFAEYGLNPAGPYPTVVTNADGETACVVQAWQYADVVGRLTVSFDAEGRVLSCDGTPHLLLGDTFQRDLGAGREELAGVEREELIAFIDQRPELSIVEPDATAAWVLDDYASQLDDLKTTVVGFATENLCVERVPDQGRSSIPGCRDATRANGGDIQQLVTDAFRLIAPAADIALQNAGGVRVDIPQGEITIATVFELLPFANTIVYLDLTGAEIKQVLEQAVSQFLDDTGSTGSYPYASNLRWNADLSQPDGSRFSDHEIRFRGSDTWVPLEDDVLVKVATNSFIASGRDNYLAFGVAFDEGRVEDTFIDYAEAFIKYLQEVVGGASPGDPIVSPVPQVEALACEDYSTQSFVGEDGALRVPAANRTCNP
jgi:5'-nucleotidase / UDP-sugar diphosphatase